MSSHARALHFFIPLLCVFCEFLFLNNFFLSFYVQNFFNLLFSERVFCSSFDKFLDFFLIRRRRRFFKIKLICNYLSQNDEVYEEFFTMRFDLKLLFEAIILENAARVKIHRFLT